MKLIDSKELKRRILDGCFLPDWVRVLINRVIDDMPVVDAEPVVHAHWIHKWSYDGDKHTVCSRCGSDKYGHFSFPYCMDCGAKMDEVIKDGKS